MNNNKMVIKVNERKIEISSVSRDNLKVYAHAYELSKVIVMSFENIFDAISAYQSIINGYFDATGHITNIIKEK